MALIQAKRPPDGSEKNGMITTSPREKPQKERPPERAAFGFIARAGLT